MVRPTVWPLDPHTRVKHLILRRYLDAWLPILASWHNRIIVFDGFAGPGRYEGGEEGSPLIILRALLEHRAFRKPRTELNMLLFFVEERADRFVRLEEELRAFEAAYPLPGWVHVRLENGEFAPFLDRILTPLEQRAQNIAPTFAFVDPFGFSGVPMDLISRLVKNPRCEVLVSFMLESINRWAWHGNPKLEAHLNELFGTTAWKDLANLSDPAERRLGLVELYRAQLMRKAGLTHVLDFEMIDEGNRTEYFLYFGTKSLKGLSAMKQAMWKADPVTGQLFSDHAAADQQLALVPALDTPVPLRELLQREFSGKGWISTDEMGALEKFVLTQTIYSERKHLRRDTLGPMEKEGLIEVQRPQGTRGVPGQYPPGTRIRLR